jgi:hypothetical protein
MRVSLDRAESRVTLRGRPPSKQHMRDASKRALSTHPDEPTNCSRRMSPLAPWYSLYTKYYT